MNSNEEILKIITNEPAAYAEVRTERGAPRLFVNGEEKFPLFAWSWELRKSAHLFRDMGIAILHPILGLNSAWQNEEEIDFTDFRTLFFDLLKSHPNSYFLPRVLLDMPGWWKDKFKEDLVKTALPIDASDRFRYHTPEINPEGGWNWGIHFEEPSLASDRYLRDAEDIYRKFLQYFENSPLRSRIIGYQIGGGIYGEWHYFLSEFLPDLNQAVSEKIGFVPDASQRLKNEFGLLRNPEKEQSVIEFYRKFHEEIIADTIIRFARITKHETGGRCLCGTFYGYQLENVWIQEGGHLAPDKILNCREIDFIASPYSYQSTNFPELPDWMHDVQDDAGNYLGRARGIGGDGGYRVLLESLKRHGKLFFVEIDPSTFLQPDPQKNEVEKLSDYEFILARIGGEGWDTIEGTKQILARDIGQMLVSGNGGWLFDFGPLLSIKTSWYDSPQIIAHVKKLVKIGEKRKNMDLSSVAEIAAVYDAQSFFVTRHWRAEFPFRKGMKSTDFFTQWFMDAQARAFHRIGAPVDFLYRFDLTLENVKRYKLIFMVNNFFLSDEEVAFLKKLFCNSGVTVVWYYAPGFIDERGLNLERMEKLTGFKFNVVTEPGEMMIATEIDKLNDQIVFGVKEKRIPRFEIVSGADEIWGSWTDLKSPAFGMRQAEGWKSVYVGAAPLPIILLRFMAEVAGVKLWSDRADIIRGTRDLALIISTENGMMKAALPYPMREIETGISSQRHIFHSKKGDVHLFVKN